MRCQEAHWFAFVVVFFFFSGPAFREVCELVFLLLFSWARIGPFRSEAPVLFQESQVSALTTSFPPSILSFE